MHLQPNPTSTFYIEHALQLVDMSLLKWSTPERRSEDRRLPIIPTEIYLLIFEYIAPYAGHLTPEDLKTFTSLSCVCRFFTNVCLPRVFGFVEFSGSVFRDDTPSGLRDDATYKTSRGNRLCRQIIENDPLALALARTVKVCHFTNWAHGGTGSWATQLFAQKYITAGLLHLTNVRELGFTKCAMHAEYWKAIASLGSLEELSFDSCLFLQGSGDPKPESLKVTRLKVEKACVLRFLSRAIDYRCLRALSAHFTFVRSIAWPPYAVLTELTLTSSGTPLVSDQIMEAQGLNNILERAPRTLETLSISMGVEKGPTYAVVQRLLLYPSWKTFSHLRSLTLYFPILEIDELTAILHSALRGIKPPHLQTFALKGGSNDIPKNLLAGIRGVLGRLNLASGLKYIDFNGIPLGLVDGEWSEVSST